MKIIGATVGTPMKRPDFNQDDPKKSDYIKNKPAPIIPITQTAYDALVSSGTVNESALYVITG